MSISVGVECPSLEGTDLELSTTNRTSGTTVQLSCDDFGHRPSGDINTLICLNTGNWSNTVPECEWTWDFTTQEKIIFGTSVAAVSFIIVVLIAVFVAYFCCYKKRKDGEEKLYESSYHGSSPRVGYNGPYNERGTYPDTYLAYQDIQEKYDGYPSNGTLDKPWLGYIPRPKVSEGRFYN
ncbi:uncharacterized protein LOC101863089 [Aplysia californica]|uniref:Uncharacterized protein LOC101863089 n=1 Tax=Aplysia californica TaxID=6500 RepID=A0ABM0ZVI0_APLCA|nr:uncharacterized protein LOC101863089 [Aplysia californica]